MIPGIVSAPLFASVQGMEAVASPSTVRKTQGSTSGSTFTLTTPTTTVTVTGGTPPYSHSWAGSGITATATAPTSATTAFQAMLGPGETDLETFTDTIIDANGVQTTASCNVVINNVDLR